MAGTLRMQFTQSKVQNSTSRTLPSKLVGLIGAVLNHWDEVIRGACAGAAPMRPHAIAIAKAEARIVSRLRFIPSPSPGPDVDARLERERNLAVTRARG